jgi:hypothetical protein
MKLKHLAVAAVVGLGLVGSAMAADSLAGMKALAQSENGLTVSGDVHAQSSYQYRGMQFSDGNPSIGASITARHSSGLYGTLESDTINLTPGASNLHQLQNQVTVGYDFRLPHDVTVGGGFTRNIFTGQNHVNDLSFSEAFVGADWNGLYAKVSTVIESASAPIAGFQTGDTFGEIGYTYHLNQFSLGGDVGYGLHNHADVGQKNGLSLAQVRVGYSFNDHVDVGVTYQFAGNDAYGFTNTGTHKVFGKVDYKF